MSSKHIFSASIGHIFMETLTHLTVFLHSFVMKILSLTPKLFCVVGVLLIYLTPEHVTQMVNQHGILMLLQPLFIEGVITALTLTVIVILFISALERLNDATLSHAIAQHNVKIGGVESPAQSLLLTQQELMQLRPLANAAYSYHCNYPVWKAQQELRSCACELAENNISMPHFDELDSYLGRIVDAAKCAVDQQYPFSNTNGFHSSCLDGIRGEIPLIVNDASPYIHQQQ